MRPITILLLVCTGLALCGCGAASPAQPETGGDPLEITAFSFYHTASSTDGCYSLTLTREETGTHLYAEELFSGGRIADAMIADDVLERLGELAGTYRVDRWDGFDKNNKRVMDGSTFTLSVTCSDGTTISAHGNNAFPENYADVSAEIRTLYDELMAQYAS